MSPEDVDKMLKQVLLKDLRIQCRARGLSPAGGKEQLSERLKEHMLATNDFNMKNEQGEDLVSDATAGVNSADMAQGFARNNYTRPSGQNVGNFLTDRCSSRVLAPPGGGSSISFGGPTPAAPSTIPAAAPAPMQAMQAMPQCPPPAQQGWQAAAPAAAQPPAPGALSFGANEGRGGNNNYSRPEGQNVGNFLTDKRAVKVHGPPGGASQITFG